VLDDYINPKIFDDEYRFDPSGDYFVPATGSDLADYRSHINDLPDVDDPEVFGMHSNAAITSAIRESSLLFGTVAAVQPKSVAGAAAASHNNTVVALATEILAKLPANFDVHKASARFPVVYSESMNTVLVQELIRFNKLLDAIRSTLISLQKAIKGEVVMSLELEQMQDRLFNARVPQQWSAVSYPSLKPLAPWVVDLLARLDMFESWLKNGPPIIYNISYFFFTQSFLTGTLQNHARKHKIPIDEVSFAFDVRPDVKAGATTEAADSGCFVTGLFLEGAQWSVKDGVLQESDPGQLFSRMPAIWLKPMETKAMPTGRLEYDCPVYKTSARAGQLSTTGHSTNFVLSIKLRSVSEAKHWVKRGVALLTQLDE
jgi:dynein heavy chain